MTTYGIGEEIDTDSLLFGDLPDLLDSEPSSFNESRHLTTDIMHEQVLQNITAAAVITQVRTLSPIQISAASTLTTSASSETNPVSVDTTRRRATRKQYTETNSKEEPIVILDNEKGAIFNNFYLDKYSLFF